MLEERISELGNKWLKISRLKPKTDKARKWGRVLKKKKVACAKHTYHLEF